MPRFRNTNHRATSNVCHRIVLPRRRAVPAGRASAYERPAAAPEAGEGQESAGRFAEAQAEKELVERAVARIRAEAEAVAGRGPDDAHRRQIQILERRLEKLAKLLEQRESELEWFKRRGLEEPGVASVFDSVQGLDPEEPLVESKRQLMRRIFEQNIALHAALRGDRSA